MAAIRKLSPEIIGQIAAGEVVERPAAAVKELVENSIDAGAKNITVELREGGIKYLRVSDNGRGIPAEQIRMAFERHATSKISKPQDLFDIHTLGFRGEALASIAAVSKVTCTTRTQEASFGTRAVVEAGEFTDIRQAASPVGTTIVAEDLFFNTPVRLKFLKKPAAEATLVSDYMLRLILSHPEVAFRFVSQGKTVYHSTGDGKLDSALYAIYGREAFQQMRKVSGHMNGVLLSGYVGVGDLARGNRQQQSFFVNGRYFRSAILSRALEKGCEGNVMIGRFPMCALFLEMPNQTVDVNVHPNKLEVRFQNEIGVAAAVEALVRDAMRAESLGSRLSQNVEATESAAQEKESVTIVELHHEKEIEAKQIDLPEKNEQVHSAPPLQSKPMVPDVPVAPATVLRESAGSFVRPASPIVVPVPPSFKPFADEAPFAPQNVRKSEIKPHLSPEKAETKPLQPGVYHQPVQEAAAKPVILPEKQLPASSNIVKIKKTDEEKPAPVQTVLEPVEQMEAPLRLVGILFDTYWLFESGDRVLMVDQHAAHERILYDRFMERFENEHLSQKLLSPQLVTLTAHDMLMLSEFQPLLAQAGFEVERFDDTSIAVHAVPTFFGDNESPRELLMEALSEWQAGRVQVTREKIRKRVAQMACKRAIKGGDRLSEMEIEGFMKEILKSDSMPTCPHGRPIVTEITRYALEKRFKRIQ